jgi:hypothetical protein
MERLGDVRIGVFPECKKLLIDGASPLGFSAWRSEAF